MGANSKLALFGGVQTASPLAGSSIPWPSTAFQPVASGQATGELWPLNWYRDQFTFNFFVYENGGGPDNPAQGTLLQNTLATIRTYLDSNKINGPCVQLLYPANEKSSYTLADYQHYLGLIAPYIPAGSYQITANEILNAGNGLGTPPSSILDALGGAGTTGYDALFALIKLQRQSLPSGVLLGLNDVNIADYSNFGGGLNFYNAAAAIKVYNLCAQNGAPLDWLGLEGYWFNSTLSLANFLTQLNSVASQLVTTAGTGAPNTIALTEFTPNGGGGPLGPFYPTQLALWQAFLPALAANQFLFGLTGPWGNSGHLYSGAFDKGNFFFNDSASAINPPDSPDGVSIAPNSPSLALPYVQDWANSNFAPTPPIITPPPVITPPPIILPPKFSAKFGDQFWNPCQPILFPTPLVASLPPASRYIVTTADLNQPF